MTSDQHIPEVAWGIETLKVPVLWNYGFTGESVRVGHLDTGLDGEHPALRSAIDHFVYFDNDGKEKSCNGGEPFDSGEHGTHTAGIIAGRPSGGNVIGVAPSARLVSAVVIEDGDIRARLLAGIRWAMSTGIRVLNISVGLRGWCRSFLPIMQEVCKEGILPVVAIGDEGPGKTLSPGNYYDALSVGACDEQEKVPEFSSSERFRRRLDPIRPEIIAPGSRIRSTAPGGNYQVMSGTSMAAAHISGLAALLWQAAPNACSETIKSAILHSCRLPADVAPSRGGLGIPDAIAALKLLTGIDACL